MIKKDIPLKVEGELCGKRIIDSLYKSGEEYYFLDIGWVNSPSHPDHGLGKLIKEENDKWTFQDEDGELFVVSPINDSDRAYGGPMIRAYQDWKDYLKENHPNADGMDFIQRDFELKEIERIA